MNEDRHYFEKEQNKYQICEQPIPEWREEMTKENELDQKEEIPHREQQIQWHEDKLHSLRTCEPMREWEFRHAHPDGAVSEWSYVDCPEWRKDVEYRRKPRTVTYWHCLVRYVTGAIEFEILSKLDKKELYCAIEDLKQYAKSNDQLVKFGQVIETTAEVED